MEREREWNGCNFISSVDANVCSLTIKKIYFLSMYGTPPQESRQTCLSLKRLYELLVAEALELSWSDNALLAT